MKKYLTILSLLITSLSYSQIKVIKVQGQGGISKADSINGYVTPAQLRTKVDTAHKDITNVFAPLYSVNVNDSTHELHVYMSTDSTLSDASNTAVVSGKAIKGYVDNHSSGGSTDTTSLSNRIDSKQATLVSGANIKTINGGSLLGSGDLVVGGGSTDTSHLSDRINLKKDNADSTNSITGYTTRYQSSLKANSSLIVPNSGTMNVVVGSRPVLSSINYLITPPTKITNYTDFHGWDYNMVSTNDNISSFGSIYQQENSIRFNSTDSMATAVPFFSHVQNLGTGNMGGVKGIRIQTQNTSGGTIGGVYNVYSENPAATAGSISNFIGYYLDSATAGSQNNTGIYIGPVRGGSVSNYGVYSLATSNYLAGLTAGAGPGITVPSGNGNIVLFPSGTGSNVQFTNNYGVIDNSTSKFFGGLTLGSASTNGTSFFVNTASVNSGFSAGFGVDGTYTSPTATVRLTAFGPKSGGLSGNFLFRVGVGTSVKDIMTLDQNGFTVTGKIAKAGGIASQFLKADGSVDSSIYITSTGNAATSTKLQTARTINGVPFDGTANITTSVIGTAPPTTTPAFVGQEFIDTTNKKVYKATGTASSADWTILN